MTISNVSPAQQWATDAVNLERGFLPAVVEALTQWDNGNRTDLSILLTVTHGIKTDLVPVIEGQRLPFATPLKKILGFVMPDMTYKADKKKASGVTYVLELDADGDPYCDPAIVREELEAMAESGVTVKSDMFKEWVKINTAPKEVEPKPHAATVEKAAKDAPRTVKTAYDQGHNRLAYLHAMRDEYARMIRNEENVAVLLAAE